MPYSCEPSNLTCLPYVPHSLIFPCFFLPLPGILQEKENTNDLRSKMTHFLSRYIQKTSFYIGKDWLSIERLWVKYKFIIFKNIFFVCVTIVHLFLHLFVFNVDWSGKNPSWLASLSIPSIRSTRTRTKFGKEQCEKSQWEKKEG